MKTGFIQFLEIFTNFQPTIFFFKVSVIFLKIKTLPRANQQQCPHFGTSQNNENHSTVYTTLLQASCAAGLAAAAAA